MSAQRPAAVPPGGGDPADRLTDLRDTGGSNPGDPDPDAVRLVLVRHGQTDSNVRRALDSRPPGAPLNERGTAQAAALARRLAGEQVRSVYASLATRAQQTAAPVAAVHGLAVDVLDGVHEVFVGELEGRFDEQAIAEFDRVYAAWARGELTARLPGGESARDLHERFLPTVQRITAGVSGAVVLVSHGAAIRLAAAALLGDAGQTGYVPNTGVVVLRAEARGWHLDHWDPAPQR